MSSRLSNVILAVAFVVLLAANVALGNRDVSERNFEFLPTMVHSVPYNAYSAHEDLPDGMAMQMPPAGTIKRGAMPLRFGPGPEEALRAGRELSTPLLPSANEARGQHLYDVYCQLCHGPEGRGDGTVAQRGFPAPPAFNSETSATLEEGQIFHIITFGQNNMPSHASQIDPLDRWHVVRYMQELRSKLLAETPAVAASEAASDRDSSGEAPAREEEVQP